MLMPAPLRIPGIRGSISRMPSTDSGMPIVGMERLGDTILDTLHALVVVLDARGRVVRFNRGCERATGWTEAEVRGRRFFALFIPADQRDGVEAVFQRLVAGDFPNEYENDWLTRTGTRRRIAWRNSCVTGPDGSVQLVIGTGIDVTDRQALAAERDAADLHFQALFERAPTVAIQVMDAAGAIVGWNAACETLYGFPAEAVLGQPLADVIGMEGGQPLLLELFDQIRCTGRALGPLDIGVRHRDGSARTVRSSLFALGDTPPRYVCMDIDVTEEMRVQRSLRAVAALGGDGDTFFGALVRVLSDLLGTRYALVGEIGDDGWVSTLATWAGSAAGPPLRYRLEGTPCANVARSGVCLYGSGVAAQFPADVLLTQMGVESYFGVPLRDAEGATIGLLVALHDQPIQPAPHLRDAMLIFAERAGAELTRSRARRSLAAREQHLRAVLDGIGDAVFACDHAGRVTRMNPVAERLSGWCAAEAVGRMLAEVAPLTAAVAGLPAPELVAQVLAGAPGAGSDQPLALVRRGGGTVRVAASATPLPGESPGAVLVLRDISEALAQADALRHAQQLTVAGQIAGAVAHDLNNLIGAILGWSDLLRSRLADRPDLAGHAERIGTAIGRARALTGQMLHLARKGADQPVVYDANAVVREALSLFTRLGQVEIAVALEQPVACVAGFPGQLENAVLNLCLNARDAGARRIAVSTSEDRSGAAPRLRLAVVDDGCGMDEQVRARCLEPFFTTKGERGTGLGLASVRQAVHDHQGTLELHSEPGRGTSMMLLLPLVSG
jgi:PAS domain S-box-containing protein